MVSYQSLTNEQISESSLGELTAENFLAGCFSKVLIVTSEH